MTDIVLGTILDKDAPPRDAIHIAVAMVIAGETLKPADDIGFMEGADDLSIVIKCKKPVGNPVGGDKRSIVTNETKSHKGGVAIGIVDPFLDHPVKKGERFYMFLYQNTVTSLRHHWEHPAFAVSQEAADKSESEQWLRRWAAQHAGDYEEMVAGAVSGEGYCFGDDDGPPQYGGQQDEFWRHMENVTGMTFSQMHKDDTVFRCTC